MTLCVLHIGSEKTGTSSIQKYFADNRDALLNEGLWYPRAFSHAIGHVHLKLSDAAMDESLSANAEQSGQFRAEYEAAMKAGAGTTVFSSEFFHSQLRSPAPIARLRAFLTPFFDCFQIVYYARRQDQLLASMHSTSVRGGWTTNPSALSVFDSKGPYYFNHLAICNNWSQVFGRENLTCRIYERGHLANGDIIDDFSATVGLAIDTTRKRVSTNESLSFETMSALLLVNASPHSENEEFRRRLIAQGRKRKGERMPMLTREQAETFLARWTEQNGEFFSRYVNPALATDFSGDFKNYPESLPSMPAGDILNFIFDSRSA